MDVELAEFLLMQFLVLTMAGWLNRQQECLIDYLREENRVLREQLGCPEVGLFA